MDFSELALEYEDLNTGVNQLIANRTEKVVVKATSREGFISGLYAVLNIVGNSRTFKTPLIVSGQYGIAEIYVPFGTEYSVSVQSYQGEQPPSQNFTADRTARDVEFVYSAVMAPLGVWIQAIDNSLHSSADWPTTGAGKTARGVAVITADHAFLIGKNNLGTFAWGGYGTDVAGIPNITQQYAMVEDFDFEEKTTAIIESLNPDWDGSQPANATTSGFNNSNTIVYNGTTTTTVGAPAAEKARAYSCADMPAGSWSLPSGGVLMLMYLNKAAINACLTAIGGNTLVNDAHWSCTEYSSSYAWYVNMNTGTQNYYNRSSAFSVRAVAAFQSH